MDDSDTTNDGGRVSAGRSELAGTGNPRYRATNELKSADMRCLVRRMTNCAQMVAMEALLGAEVADDIEFVLLAVERNSSYSALVHEDDRAFPRPGGEDEGRGAGARALSFLRELRGHTQKTLAKASGLHNATISSYERGRRAIGERNLESLLDALGLPLRAWEATVRHIEWLDWLVQRRRDAEGVLPGASLEEPLGADLHREVTRVAEAAGREREQTVTRVLDLLLRGRQ